MTIGSRQHEFYRLFGKRIFDLVFSVFASCVLAPLIACVAVAVWRNFGRPVIFAQLRPGLKGQPFVLYKFRSMSDARGSDGKLLSDAERLTSFGSFLRRTSLDELPELWNIFKGDMSFVGPRPLLMQYLPLYSPEQARRHELSPGLTGLAQISGRNAISWEQKFAADIYYVERCSITLDLCIIIRTIGKIIQSDGINAPGETTMPAFEGNGEVQTSASVGTDGRETQ